MRSRKFRIITNVIMFLVLLFMLIPPKHTNVSIHIVGGITFAIILIIHIIINRKILASLASASRQGKLSGKMKRQNVVDWILIGLWSIMILAGLISIGFSIGDVKALFVFYYIHNVFGRLSVAFIIVHLFQHKRQIASYFKTK